MLGLAAGGVLGLDAGALGCVAGGVLGLEAGALGRGAGGVLGLGAAAGLAAGFGGFLASNTEARY